MKLFLIFIALLASSAARAEAPTATPTPFLAQDGAGLRALNYHSQVVALGHTAGRFIALGDLAYLDRAKFIVVHVTNESTQFFKCWVGKESGICRQGGTRTFNAVARTAKIHWSTPGRGTLTFEWWD